LEDYYREVCVGGNTTNCVDLSVLVTEGYIAEIPEDPKGGGYKVGISSNNRVSVVAEKAVLGESIVLNKLVPEWNTEAFEGENYLAKISAYFAPPRSFDPTAINQIGTLSADLNKWSGFVLAPNGKIYGIPLDSESVLEIDPNTQTTMLFGNFVGTHKWNGGVLAPNGKIYGIPSNPTQILEFDPETKEVNTFGDLGNGSLKWNGGVLAPNGKIYGIPSNSTQILEFDPETKEVNTFGDLGNGLLKWSRGVLAPNGKIYGIPSNSSEVLEFDPNTKNIALFGSLSSSSINRRRIGS